MWLLNGPLHDLYSKTYGIDTCITLSDDRYLGWMFPNVNKTIANLCFLTCVPRGLHSSSSSKKAIIWRVDRSLEKRGWVLNTLPSHIFIPSVRTRDEHGSICVCACVYVKRVHVMVHSLLISYNSYINPLNVVTIYIYGHIKLPVIAATIYICSRQVHVLSMRS